LDLPIIYTILRENALCCIVIVMQFGTSMAKNLAIETGARVVAEDFLLPGDRRKSIAKLVRGNLSWFDGAEARGMFVDDMLQMLTKAGATHADGTSINFSTLSNALWRVRGMAATEKPNKAAATPPSRLTTGSTIPYETGAVRARKTQKTTARRASDVTLTDAASKGPVNARHNVISDAGGEHADILARLSRTTTARRAAKLEND
jgi:hypothetical protein